jgi:hypothetical protein
VLYWVKLLPWMNDGWKFDLFPLWLFIGLYLVYGLIFVAFFTVIVHEVLLLASLQGEKRNG